jgi:hypothetical protein
LSEQHLRTFSAALSEDLRKQGASATSGPFVCCHIINNRVQALRAHPLFAALLLINLRPTTPDMEQPRLRKHFPCGAIVVSCPHLMGGIVSCRVVLCCVESCRVVSCRVVSCRVVSCRVVSCRVVSCRVVSCRVVSCRVVLCCVEAALGSRVNLLKEPFFRPP